MKNFAQRIDEKSSISPSGFTGFIIKNSNVVIDKSFIEKGSSFVNAFENSNVILKDCGTPVPIEKSSGSIVTTLNTKLLEEVERKTLPPWVNYKLKHYNIWEDTSTGTEINPKVGTSNINMHLIDVVNKKRVNDAAKTFFDKVTDYRNNLIGNNVSGQVLSKFSIENQIIKNNEISSKDVNFTISGAYYLSGLDSAIKAVWPLDENFKTDKDEPTLSLQFKERMTFPISVGEDYLTMSDVYETDSFGNYITDVKTKINIDEDIPSQNHNGTYKFVAQSELNEPLHSTDFQTIEVTDEKSYFNLIQNTKQEYFIQGPYTDNTVLYNVRLRNGVLEYIHNEPLTYYFPFRGSTVSLRDLLNVDFSNKSAVSKSSLSPISKYLNILSSNFLNDKIDLNKNVLNVDIVSGLFSDSSILGNASVYYALGFKNKNKTNNVSSTNTIELNGKDAIEAYLGEDGLNELLNGAFEVTLNNSISVRNKDIKYVAFNDVPNVPSSSEYTLKNDVVSAKYSLNEDIQRYELSGEVIYLQSFLPDSENGINEDYLKKEYSMFTFNQPALLQISADFSLNGSCLDITSSNILSGRTNYTLSAGALVYTISKDNDDLPNASITKDIFKLCKNRKPYQPTDRDIKANLRMSYKFGESESKLCLYNAKNLSSAFLTDVFNKTKITDSEEFLNAFFESTESHTFNVCDNKDGFYNCLTGYLHDTDADTVLVVKSENVIKRSEEQATIGRILIIPTNSFNWAFVSKDSIRSEIARQQEILSDEISDEDIKDFLRNTSDLGDNKNFAIEASNSGIAGFLIIKPNESVSYKTSKIYSDNIKENIVIDFNSELKGNFKPGSNWNNFVNRNKFCRFQHL